MPLEPVGNEGDLQSGGGSTPPPPATAPAPAAPSATPPPSVQEPAAGGATLGQTAQTAQSVRDALAGYGLDIRGQFQDDHSALQYLAQAVQQAEQVQQLAQYGQLYLRHADRFQAFMQQEEERQRQQQAQQQKPWFEAPEYDPSWQSKIYRDQNGELRVVPGADPALVQKYLRWVEHQRSFIDKLSQDPIGTIRPGIEQLIDQRAQQIVEARLRQNQEQQVANTILQQNTEWMFQHGPNGQVQRDMHGRPVLSPVGERYGHYVLLAQNTLGIPDSQRQHDFAVSMLQRDILLWQYQQGLQAAQSANPGDAAKAQFLNQATQGQLPATTPPAGNVNGSQQPPSIGSRGLEEMMRREFAAAGIRPDALAT